MQSYVKNAKKYKKLRLQVSVFVFILTLFSTSLVEIKAQNSSSSMNPSIHFGIQAGGVVATAFPAAGKWDFGSPKTKVGFSGSAFFEWNFSRSKKWFAHIELGVGSARIKAEGTSVDTSIGSFSLDAKYINIVPAIGIGYNILPIESPFNVHILACVTGSFPEQRATPAITIKRQDITADFQKSIGARLECGFRYEFVSIALRYEYEFLPIMNISGQKFTMGYFDFVLRFRFF